MVMMHLGDSRLKQAQICLERAHVLRDKLRDRASNSEPLDVDLVFAEAIRLARDAVTLLNNQDLEWNDANILLGALLHKHAEHAEIPDQAMEALTIRRATLASCSRGHSLWINLCAGLSDSLQVRFSWKGEISDLIEAINFEREVLSLCPEDDPGRPVNCERLAYPLFQLFRHTHNEEQLLEAEQLQRQALRLLPNGDPNRGIVRKRLIEMLDESHDNSGDINILSEVIELENEQLASCPKGHLDHASCVSNLAISLAKYHRKTGDQEYLRQGINLHRELLESFPEGHSDRADILVNLAVMLRMSYRCTGEVSCLSEAIQFDREVLHSRPADHPERAESINNLAVGLVTLHECTGHDALLIEALHWTRKALELCPIGHPQRAMLCSNLAIVIKNRYKSSGDGRSLTEAMKLDREALHLRPPGHPDRQISCLNLASSLYLHYNATGDKHSLTEGIELLRSCMAVSSLQGSTEHRIASDSLAASLSTWFELTGDKAALAEAVELQRALLQIQKAIQSPDRIITCGNLAYSLTLLYGVTGDGSVLLEAVNLDRQSLECRPKGHPERAMSCSNLAAALLALYYQTGSQMCLIEAIEKEREGLEIRGHGHPDRTKSLLNLGALLTQRALCIRYINGLWEANALIREAMELLPRAHPAYALVCANLAFVQIIFHLATNDENYLTDAIRLQREALTLRSHNNSPDRIPSLRGLAYSLWLHYRLTGSRDSLSEGILRGREALRTCLPSHIQYSLCCATMTALLEDCYNDTAEAQILSEVSSLSQQAILTTSPHDAWSHFCSLAWVHLRPRSSFFDVSKAIECLKRSLGSDVDDAYELLSSIMLRLEDIWKDIGANCHAELTPIYQGCVNLLPLATHLMQSLTVQAQAMRRFSDIGPDAFVNACLVGPHMWMTGLEILEMTQGVLWARDSQQRDPLLHGVPEQLSKDLKDSLAAVQAQHCRRPYQDCGILSSFVLPDLRYFHCTRIHDLVRQIRSTPGMERFMLGKTYDELRQVASSHPVVVLVGTRGYFYALILSPLPSCLDTLLSLSISDQDIVDMKSFTRSIPTSQRSIVTTSLGGTPSIRLGLQPRAMHTSTSNHWDNSMRSLWLKIVKPILQYLGLQSSPVHRPRIHWFPTGIFNGLPFHAAGIYHGAFHRREYCSDYVVSSYTSTLTVLRQAQTASSGVSLATQDLSLALIAEKEAQDHTMPLLAGVDAEIEAVATIAKSRNVKNIIQQSGSTTIEDTFNAIQTANIIHIACHGVQNNAEAAQSAFCLGDGQLTISQLTDLKTNHSFLAFLSACETAKGDQQQPDLNMHLAAALLFSGYKSVVATMWAIADADGPRVAQSFYKELFSSTLLTAEAVPYALDHAVRELRELGVSPERWVPFIHMGA